MSKNHLQSKNQYLLQDKIAAKFKILDNEHFSKLAMFNGTNNLSVTKPDDKQINYTGVAFSGSVIDVEGQVFA